MTKWAYELVEWADNKMFHVLKVNKNGELWETLLVPVGATERLFEDYKKLGATIKNSLNS